jgi:succinoglycan biosynthesis protein ExoM
MNIAVVAITYKRPDGLRKLLRELLRQDLSGLPVEQMNIVIVDNDPQGSAAPVLGEFNEFGASGKIRITGLHEKRPGIPFARNCGMAHAIEDNDYFIFIDDDEYPGPTWLRGLLTVAIEMYSDCVLGAVTPAFPQATPAWIRRSRIFEGWKHPHRTQIFEAASNNVLVRSAFIQKHGITFDERMQASGGSDYRFFRQCVAAGMVIHWSAEAEVFEDIPRSRTTLRWMIQRQIRLGNTFALDARLSRHTPRILKLYAVGLARAAAGLFALPTLLLSRRWGTSAAIHLLRGIGIITGIHGYRHDEYARSRLEQERSAT